MSRHAAGHGMDGVFHFSAFSFQSVSQLLHQVLSLGDGHAISRHDDNFFRFVQDVSRIGGNSFFGCRGRFGSLFCFAWFGRGNTGFAKQNIHETGVHSPTHDLSEQQAAGPNDSAHGHQENIADGHAGNRTGDTAKGVEQGNSDWHVCPANSYGDGNSPEAAKNSGGGHFKANGNPWYKGEDD